MMNYDEFKAYIMEHVVDYFPKEYQIGQISIEKMRKNNDTELDGLRIMNNDSNIAPIIYINSSFEMYKTGMSIDEIVEKIAQNYMENMNPSMDVNIGVLSDFESVKDNISCRLVNAETNEKRLENAPVTPMADLAVSYHVVVSQNQEGVASFMITNDLMERYGVDVGVLNEVAMANMEQTNKPVFMPLADVMMEAMLDDFMKEFNVSEEQAREMLRENIPTDGPEIYCLTNESKINGAAALANPKVQEMISEKVGGDYYILPSSVHEVLIVPMNANMSYEELEAMVQEVNATQVQPEEVLSDHVYQYDGKNHVINRCDQVQKKQEHDNEKDREHLQGMEKEETKEQEKKEEPNLEEVQEETKKR